ncbi:hypothetical protein [Mesotoga sp. UBA5847]|jgi:hypothetical protein|uniref:hypothetical protein n=1 Tax=Mesotoga sp. UBA5847 TaxID=1946859 RepID=UPI0025CF05EE|nr:hypothetical protein [Mesotoga sp. UBA5847]
MNGEENTLEQNEPCRFSGTSGETLKGGIQGGQSDRNRISADSVKQKCIYRSFCDDLNGGDRERVVCLKCLKISLDDLSWRERAVYKFEPYTESVEKITLSVQYRNPCYKFDFLDCDCIKDEPKSVYIPLFTFAKPLMFSLNISQSFGDQQFILQRFTEARAMSKIFLEESRLIARLHNKFGTDDIELFLAALMASDGGKRMELPREKILYNDFFDEVRPYLNQTELFKLTQAIEKSTDASLRDYLKLIRTNRNSIKEKFETLREGSSSSEACWESNSSLVNQCGHELIEYLGACAGTIHEEFIEKSYSAFSFPVHSLRDYLYLKSNYGRDSAEVLSSDNVLKFLEMCAEYESLISGELTSILDTISNVLPSSSESSTDDSSKLSGIESCKPRYLELVSLSENVNRSFLVLGAVPTNVFRALVKTHFTSRMAMSRSNVVTHTISLASAQSVHVHIATVDSAYSMKDKHSDEGFFGRRISSNKVIHRNTRKYSTTAPAICSPKGFYLNLVSVTSTKTISMKYKLSGTIVCYFAILLSSSILVLISMLSQLGLFNYLREIISNDLFMKIIPKVSPGSSATTISFLSATIIPLLGTIIPLLFLDHWSLAHTLLRGWKWTILIVNLVILITIAMTMYFQ